MKRSNVFDLLAASGPFIEQAEKLMDYGQFVGRWEVDSVWYKGEKVIRKAKRRWVFDWILGGRGIQDVLFADGAKPAHYGTTLRVYDALLDAWHISWMCPAQGEFVTLLARRIGDRIVQEGLGGDYLRRERWSFTEITPDSFVWLGEVSFDRGATWVLEQRMRAARIREE